MEAIIFQEEEVEVEVDKVEVATEEETSLEIEIEDNITKVTREETNQGQNLNQIQVQNLVHHQREILKSVQYLVADQDHHKKELRTRETLQYQEVVLQRRESAEVEAIKGKRIIRRKYQAQNPDQDLEMI